MRPLVPTFIIERFKKNEKRGSFCSTTLFVDISGFTPLTEQLMQQGTEGAEILSDILDQIFEPMVERVYAQGGIIPHFAGDAFTTIFEGEKTKIVADIALEIKLKFDEKPFIQTKFGRFKINVRIGLSYGLVEWGILGNNLKTFYFKGSAVERATLAQMQAQPQEIVIDRWFKEIFNAQNIDLQCINENFSILNATPNSTPLSIKCSKSHISLENNSQSVQQLTPHDLAYFIPSHIIEQNVKGEFREVVAMFISFANVHEYADLEAISSIILKEFESYGGYFKEIDFSEKNGVMVGFFGAPKSFENNTIRALECALAIQNELSLLQTKKPYLFRFGLASGMAFAGIVGGQERCQYAVVGDRVNLAARLMQSAEWSEILVNKNMLTARAFEFREKGNVTYKGMTFETPTFQLLKKCSEEKTFFSGNMIGRDLELEKLFNFSRKIIQNKAAIVANIYGEAGIGKSRLTYELRQNLEKIGDIYWANCPVDQILKKSFNPFVYFLKQFFHQNPEKTAAENKVFFENALENVLKSLEKQSNTEGGELMRTKSVLAGLLGLTYPDSLWEQLDAKGRYDNILIALSSLFISLSMSRSLIIELEDAHWMDDDSQLFLNHFIKKIAAHPILILTTSRYNDEGIKTPIFEDFLLKEQPVLSLEIDLNSFTKAHLLDFSTHILRGGIHPDFAETLWRTTNGNPFYAEQILDYFIENDLLQLVDNELVNSKIWQIKDPHVKISNSISAVLTARIDRLSTILKETVKAAAVIGREFELPILTEVMMAHDEYIRRNGNGKSALREQVKNAENGQIWSAMNELRYIFKHSLLREAIYDMQLKTRLRELHEMIAKAIEKIYTEHLDDRFIDLAFHYEQANNSSKTNEYLKKAGDFARRNFQNQQALDLYDRLLKNTKNKDETLKALLKKGEILLLIGQWEASEYCFKEALNLAISENMELFKGRVYNALGLLLMLKGNYFDAQNHLEKAAAFSEQIIDYQGIAKAYGNLGNLYFRHGEYEKAKDYYTQSISISRENNLRSNAQIVSHLGLTYMNQGNYTEGVHCQEEELKICELQNNSVGMSNIYVNLGIVWSEKGDYQNALDCLEKGLILSQKLGNKQLTSIAMGCVGNVWLQKGDFEKAQNYFEQDFKMAEELGDKQGVAIACELFAKLHSAKGEFEKAIHFFEKSLSLSSVLHYQKGIAKALHGMGEVFAFQCDYLKALDCLEKAIDVSRKINNNLILGNCLTDKGNVLIRLGDISGARMLQYELKSAIDFSGSEKLFSYSKSFFSKI